MGDEAPLGTKPLWNTEGLSLPGPFRSLVRHLMHDADPPMTKDHAIATAWSQARKWAAKGNARWVRVVAQLEAARTAARATPNKSDRRGVSAARPPTREVLMASAPSKKSPPAGGGKNTAGGAGKGNGGPPPKPGGKKIETVADVRAAVAALGKLPPPLKAKALDRIRTAARGIGPAALKLVPGDPAGGGGGKS